MVEVELLILHEMAYVSLGNDPAPVYGGKRCDQSNTKEFDGPRVL